MNCRIIHSKCHSSSFIWLATLTTCGEKKKRFDTSNICTTHLQLLKLFFGELLSN